MPARRKLGPIRRSSPIPSATLTTSAPVASQTFAISLMNEMRVTSAALAASLIISAEATSARTTGASIPACSCSTTSASASSNAPITIRSGLHEVAHGRALGRELGVRDVADVLEPALVEAVANRPPGADRHRALHRQDDAPLDLRQLVDDRPDRREVGVARVRRRRAHRDVDDVGAVERLVDLGREAKPLAVALEQLVEPLLVDRHLAAAQRVDPLLDDVADDDVVAEVGEAGAGDEADVAGAEDRDPHRASALLPSG